MSGPVYWVPLLASLADLPVEGGFVVAGGCVRDYALGLEPKDIDLCIPMLPESELAALAEMIDELPNWAASFTPVDMSSDSAYTEIDAAKLVGVIKATWHFNDVDFDVDIISRVGFSSGPLEGVSRFDWGILQCWYDPDTGTIRRSELGQQDYFDRRATLSQDCDGLVERSLQRFAAFDARNPNVLRPYYKGNVPIPQEAFNV